MEQSASSVAIEMEGGEGAGGGTGVVVDWDLGLGFVERRGKRRNGFLRDVDGDGDGDGGSRRDLEEFACCSGLTVAEA